jgi:hypothetical protein
MLIIIIIIILIIIISFFYCLLIFKNGIKYQNSLFDLLHILLNLFLTIINQNFFVFKKYLNFFCTIFIIFLKQILSFNFFFFFHFNGDLWEKIKLFFQKIFKYFISYREYLFWSIGMVFLIDFIINLNNQELELLFWIVGMPIICMLFQDNDK